MSRTSDEASLFRKPPPKPLPTAFSTKPAVESVGTGRRFRPSQAQTNDQLMMRLLLGGLVASAIAIILGAVGGTAIFLFSLLVGFIVAWRVADRFRQDSANSEPVEQWTVLVLGLKLGRARAEQEERAGHALRFWPGTAQSQQKASWHRSCHEPQEDVDDRGGVEGQRVSVRASFTTCTSVVA